MYVYLIKADAKRAAFKIGKANDPMARLKELQTGCPVDLELIGFVRCKSQMHAMHVERDFHHRFRFLRTREKGEWFFLSRADEQDICEQMRAGYSAYLDQIRGADLNRDLDTQCAAVLK